MRRSDGVRLPAAALLVLSLMAALAAAGCSAGPRAQDPGAPSPTAAATSDVAGLHLVADGFDSPLYVVEDGPGRLLVVEQAGVVRLVEAGRTRAAPVVDLTGRVGSDSSEQGLLGLALPGACALGGRFAVLSYTDKAGDSVVARFSWLEDGSGLEAGSEEVLLTLDQPFDNHNGGHAVFGPDCELYVGFGDGGLAGDPNLNGQNKRTWLGDLLRIHVEATGPYTIPADNPYADGAGGEQPEIWASGLRNPWRFHFDPASGDLWIADVGQNLYEEVNHQPAGVGGLNYGWNLYEGNHHFPSLAPAAAPVPGFTFPVAEYDHTEGRCSVTGGPVYRGAALPGLVGAALYADYCSGTVWRLDGPDAAPEVLLEAGFMVSSFGQDAAGEVYVLDHAAGRLFRLG